MRIAILGAGGLLGREFIRICNECIPFTHQDCDITSNLQLLSVFRYKPQVVVNCAGIVRSKVAKQSAGKVVEINSLAPHKIAAECGFRKVKFIQISTDCVFDGKSATTYDELSQPTPDDFYSVTKLAGEVYYTTIRTSFIGPSGGLLQWAINAGKITGYDEEWWNGLSTRAVAQFIIEYIKSNASHSLIHLGGQSYSKYEMLCIANKVFGLNLDIKKGPTPENRIRSRILVSRYIPKITVPLDVQLEQMK